MSTLLVSLQFLLIALLLLPLPGSSWPLASSSTAKLLVVAAGFALGLGLFAWSTLSLPRGSFSVMPEPREGNQLCERGPYRVIRHPMYTSVLICALAAAYGYAHPLKWLAALVLLIVLWLKLKREETFLQCVHAGYAHYLSRTKALVPFVW